MYGYLQDVKTNVSNGKRESLKVIKSLKLKRFFIGITSHSIKMRAQPTMQHGCPCGVLYYRAETKRIINCVYVLKDFQRFWIVF
ncbi:hypothetical protein D7X25_27045 [bacterium 1XD42-8]|nr:hypothetical protein D7X25_27045 [bacterium 1XD42-8]